MPCATLYPADWLWDAGFIALGWAADGTAAGPARAFDELDTIVRGQWADGMFPHIVFFDEDPTYFPGPSDWASGHTPPTSCITQPPVLGSVLLHLVATARDSEMARARATRLWPAVLANHRWWRRARDPEGTGLVVSYHPWETGMDNSPAFDLPLAAVPTDGLPPYRRRDTDVVVAADRPTTSDYDRYWALVLAGRAHGWDPEQLWRTHPFRVADPLTNTLLVRAEQDLCTLGQLLGAPTAVLDEMERAADRGGRALDRLWDPATGHYLACDLLRDRLVGPPTVASLIVPASRTVASYRIAHLAAEARRWARVAGCGLPSVCPDAPEFDPDRYWRGAVWINTNYLAAVGFAESGHVDMAAAIRTDSLALVEQSGSAEYFNPGTRGAHGGRSFSWTAALTLAWLAT